METHAFMKSLPRKYLGSERISRRKVKRGGYVDVLGQLAVPRRNISFAIIHNRPQLRIRMQIIHQVLHPPNALRKVHDALLVVLGVERLNDVVDRFSEDRRETDTHRGVGEGVLVVAAVGGPGLVMRGEGQRNEWSVGKNEGKAEENAQGCSDRRGSGCEGTVQSTRNGGRVEAKQDEENRGWKGWVSKISQLC